MRAVWITRPGGPDALEVRETPDPEPGPGQVRIRVHAAGLNFAEVMAAQGLYPDAPKRPCVVGYEVAGEVDALGDGASEPAVGSRVVALTQFGGHADVVCVPAGQVLPIPDSMSFEEAAAIPVNYITAYHMLFRVASIRPGERVLVHMAAGGVGMAVLQLCRTVADTEVFGTASAAKHEALRAEGCAHPIDYRTTDYAAEVRRLTGGEGVDIVLDALGGSDWRKGMKLLRPCGRLVAFGFANMASGQRRRPARMAAQVVGIPLFTPLQLMNQNRTVSGVHIGHLLEQAALLREELEAVLALWDQGKIKPRIDMAYPFAEAADAHRRILQRQNIGKVLLTP
ncbi:MAG TPA: medium chain dehydrogenase/reductase family protein [Streptosporangiaceae bacterium]|nr:medium chain dehydrogenase/reductase family protein [Streptosporangiaceae bacterium]